MNKQTRDEANHLVVSLHEEEDVEQSDAKVLNHRDALAKAIYEFLDAQFQSIDYQETFRRVIMEQLATKALAGELGVDDLIRLYRASSEQKERASNSLVNTLKQSGGEGGSSLLPFAGKGGAGDGEEDLESIYEDMPSEIRQSLDKLQRIFSQTKKSND